MAESFASNDEVSPLVQPTRNGEASNQQSNDHGSMYQFGISPEIRGMLYIMIAACSFASLDIFFRLASFVLGIYPDTVLFVKSLITLIIGAIYSWFFVPISSLRTLTTTNRIFIVVYGVLCSSFLLLWFRTLQLLPVGDAMAILFANPAVTMILSYFLLSQPFGLTEVAVVVTTIVGVYLITGHSFNIFKADAIATPMDEVKFQGYMYALGAMILNSLTFISNNKVGTSVAPMFIVFVVSAIQVVLCTLTGGAVSLKEFLSYDITGIVICTVSGILSVIFASIIVRGFQLCPPGPGSVVKTISLPVAYIEGIFMFGDRPHWHQIIGALLVVSGTIVTGMKLKAESDEDRLLEQRNQEEGKQHSSQEKHVQVDP